MQGAIGFGFASHWLKNWHESFKPIAKRSNRNHVITFDSHLKTALNVTRSITVKPGFHMIATIAAQRSQRALRCLRVYGNIHSAIFAIVATVDHNDHKDRRVYVSVCSQGSLRSLRSYGNQA